MSVKAVSPKENPRHRLIRLLPKDKQDEVTSLINSGTDVSRIIKIMQQSCGLHTDVPKDTLRKAVVRLRDDLALTRVNARLVSAGVVDNVTRLVQRVETMNEMYTLYQLQKLRLSKIMAREELLPTLMDQVGREISRASDILVKMTGLQMEMGIVARAPKVSTLTQNDDGSVTLRENSEALRVIEAFEEDAGTWKTDGRSVTGHK